jgi:hypothetical protein
MLQKPEAWATRKFKPNACATREILPDWFTQDCWPTQYLVYCEQPLNLKQVAFIYSYVFLLIDGFFAMANLDGSLRFVSPLILILP